MEPGFTDEGVYEVEDLLEWRSVDGKDHYLVKWKGYHETSWEPDENIGSELSALKESARQRSGGDGKRKREDRKAEKKEKKRKRRRADSSEDRRRRDSDSDSSRGDEMMMPPGMGMPPGMMPPGMMPPGMPPGMMPPGFGPDMPGMMPGMMPPGFGPDMGKGKGPMGPMGPPPHVLMMMQQGKGMLPPGKGPMGPPPWDPMGKGLPPPMGKGKMPMMPCGPFGGKGKPGPFPPVHREALDSQRFAVERKRRLREFAGALHGKLASDPDAFPLDKLEKTKEFQATLGLQLDGHQLPVLATSELVIADVLWLLWLFDPSSCDEDSRLLLSLASLVKTNGSRARQLLIRAARQAWPKPGREPTGEAVRLFSLLADVLPRYQGPRPGDVGSSSASHGGGPGHEPMQQPHSPEFWRDVITQIYMAHNPSKLGDVDALLTKYRGREKTLYLGICEKYKLPPKPELMGLGAGVPPGGMPPPPMGPPGAGGPPFGMGPPGWMGGPGQRPPAAAPAGDGGAADAERVKKIRALICEVYEEHNPSKLDDVDNLLTKYKGREEQVYRSICDKYKVEVKLPGKKGEEGKSNLEKYKELITEIYKEHNKDKLGEIDDLLAKYTGKEKTLYMAICKKYKVEPKVPESKKKKKGAGTPEEQKAHEELLAKVKPLICEVYQAHNPAKLEDVDQLLAKYKGREEMLYHGICEKYNVEPKLPKPAAAEAAPAEGDAAAPAEAEPKADAEGKEAKPAGGENGAIVPAPEQAAGAASNSPAALRQAYSDLIQEVYREHNPSKLEGLSKLLDKYTGQEQDLYLQVCRKYGVTPKDPEGLGDLDWLYTAEEELARLLEGMVSPLVLYSSGLGAEDAQGLAAWHEVRRRPPPRALTHRFELSGLSPEQAGQLIEELHGEDGGRVRKLQERCVGAEVAVPPKGAPAEALSVTCDGSGAQGRRPFDTAVASLTDVVSHTVRDCLDSAEGAGRFQKWLLPWTGEEVVFVSDGGIGERQEVGIELRRGCWTLGRRAAPHSHAVRHTLCGPDVEGRLPDIWRQLVDSIWSGVSALSWGSGVPMDTVVVVEAMAGNPALPPSDGMRTGCRASTPSACVVITAPSDEELERANMVIAPVLAAALGDLKANALFVPSSLCMPQLRGSRTRALAGFLARDVADASSSSASSADEADMESDEVMSDVEPSEGYRPIRLPREKVRDAYLQGLLCLNCDAADHKHQECPFRKKVCWNCHGNHPGNDCPLRCRFCKDRHDYPLLECVKRVCRRVTDWKKSKPAQEQRNVLSSFEHLQVKLEGFEDLDLAKHNREVQKIVKELNEHHLIFPGDLDELATSILDMKPPPKKAFEQITPPPPPGPPPKPYVAPKLPKDSPPPMPENKYPWSEKIFLDTLLARGMYGCNVLSRIIGRGGMHHRRMETESGARVFFRGLGVSGRDAELTDSADCRLHIAVKGEVPQQGRSVRRIISDIITGELDGEVSSRGEAGPRLDRPRDPSLHPFGFMLPRGEGAESDGPLKFKFPEEDGQTLNDMLHWLKKAKLPLELDSDTQWRTTLQVTPAEPALPDDAPPEADAIADAFGRLLEEWQYPSPYWFEEHELRPTGLWTELTQAEEDADPTCPIAVQQGQSVRLAAPAVAYFASILEQADLVPGVPRSTLEAVLRRLRGTVRRQVADEQLLLYLAYPWAWFSEQMGRSGLRLPFGKERVHESLVELGRVGSRPTEACSAPEFRGFSVEWLPVKAGVMRPDGERRPLEALASLPAAVPQAPPQVPPAYAPMPAAAPIAVPQAASSDAPRGYCKCWLPDSIFASGQDLNELIAGPGGAHFAHVLKKYPSVQLGVEGQASTAAPPAHRLHVVMSSEDSEVFESAAADVLDLVETVCDMVGEELGLSEEQVEELIQGIRAEKYFEAHGIRTPLPPARPRGAAPAPAAPAPAPSAAPVEAAVPAAVPTVVPVGAQPSSSPAAAGQGDFEFMDDVMEQAPPGAEAAGDDTEDDARTEASDCVSDITEDEAPRADDL